MVVLMNKKIEARPSRIPPYPFIKSAGGKQKMIPDIISIFPQNYGVYYEPFLGGGALFFYLRRKDLIKKAVLSDLNQHLILCYEVVRDNVDDLINELSNIKYKYDKKMYLKIRSINPSSLNKIEIAARYIYLNKTCFNGLMRVNSSGKFNTPFGKYKNPVICDELNLRMSSIALKCATLKCCDFEKAIKPIKKNDLVFLDPPYAATSKTSNFSSYTNMKFTDEDHRRLALKFDELILNGTNVILMNSIAPICHELYMNGKYNIKYVTGLRSIGGFSNRNSVKEIIVSKK